MPMLSLTLGRIHMACATSKASQSRQQFALCQQPTDCCVLHMQAAANARHTLRVQQLSRRELVRRVLPGRPSPAQQPRLL